MKTKYKNEKKKIKQDILVEFLQVSKAYETKAEKIVVLESVNVIVRKKEFIFVVGPTGAGKTTVLNLMRGMLEPDTGDIYYSGEKLSLLSPQEKSKLFSSEIGLVSEQLLPYLTVEEHIDLSWKKKRDEEILNYFLQRLNFSKVIFKKKPQELTRIDQQKILLLLAAVKSPSIVFSDEPTKTLNQSEAVTLIEFYKTIHKEKDITFVIATNDINVALQGGKIIRISNGRIG